MSSQRYSPEFKDEAVRQVLDRGHPVTEVAQRLGVWGANSYSSHKFDRFPSLVMPSPVLVSYLSLDDTYREKLERRSRRMARIWRVLARRRFTGWKYLPMFLPLPGSHRDCLAKASW